MGPTLPPLFARILNCLRRESERYFGRGDVVIEPLALSDREASEVLRIRVSARDAADRHAFVKIFKTRGPTPDDRRFMRDRVTRDFTVTSRAHEAFAQYCDLAAVQPIACFPDELVIVTEEASGERFDVMLERRATWVPNEDTLQRLAHVAERIGAWLRTFQTIERLDRQITLDGLREYLDVRLRKLVSSPKAAFTEHERGLVLSYFDARSRDVAVTDLPEVLVHADIAPSNILVNGQTIVVLDFAMAGTGGRYLDVARLFTQLEFLKAKPKFRPRVVARLQAAMLEGFDPALRPDNPLFQLFELQHVICHVANLSLNPARPAARLYNWYQLRRHLQWLHQRAA